MDTRYLRQILLHLFLISTVLVLAISTLGRASAEESMSPAPWRDEFDGSLDGGWQWVNANPAKWNLTEKSGFLRIYAAQNGTGSENLLLRPVALGDFTIETRVLFEPGTNFQFAGLVIFQDESNFLQLGRAFCDLPGACVGNGIYFDKVLNGGFADSNFATPVDSTNEAYLRLELRGGNMIKAFYSQDGITWVEIGTHWIPSGFQVNGVALTASQDNANLGIPADFDYFELTEGWGFLPEGFHDGEAGVVGANGCNAFGWAVDPDDLARDLKIQILADSIPVATTTADLLREDVTACTGGTCGFGISLWGLVSAGQEHLITVQAYDEETASWVNLYSTPKSLTCWGFPQGFHDYDSGSVPSSACNAGGWAADPDDPNRDLQVQILADGSVVATTTADLLREDVTACSGGTCGFNVSLWGLISADQEHQITVQAYDIETADWWNLESTPKMLTCLTPPPPNPYIEAFAWYDRYALGSWPAGYEVQVMVDDAGPFYFTPDDSNGWYAFYPGIDIHPGTIIQATNGPITKELVVSPLSASLIDPVAHFVSGVATPNRSFHMSLQSDPFPNSIEMDIPVDESGSWSAQFDSAGEPWQWFTRGNMWEGDDDGDVTYAIWHVRQPVVEVFLAQNEIRAFDWPLDTTLTFTVDDPATGIHEFYADTTKLEWMDGTWAVVNAGDFQLKPGMLVTVTGGDAEKSTTIQDVRITHFDPDLDLVSGYAPVGAALELRSWEDNPVFRYFNANEQGQWMIDYKEPSVNGVTVDVNSGDGFTLYLREPDKDSTIWETSVPEARLFGQYTDDHTRFETLAPGELVNFKILDQDKNQLFGATVPVNESGGAMLSIWDTRLELQPGYEIIATSASLTKHLVLEPVSLDTVDPVEDILSGTASPGRDVWVVVGNEPERCGQHVTADEGGNWIFDFDEISCDFDEEMAIQSYAQVSDAEGDTSEAFVNFIEGYHDYDTGDVPIWACNVGGWAYDSNDRTRDLQLQILVDDSTEPVMSLLASNPVDWAVGVCGADATCGFEANLWGLITPYVEHLVTVQALDEETGQWINLRNTPRSLTCRTYDIYAFDPLTGDTTQITDMRDTDEYNPSWSPNGKQVAHDVVFGDGSQSIYITDVKTKVSTPLAGAGNGSNDAAWSPNGKWIVFDRAPIGDSSLYLVPPAGGVPVSIRGDAVSADWAPNGKRLVFQQPSDGSIRTVPVDGGKAGETLIAVQGSTPSWSPDGSWIAYEFNGDIWKVPVNVQGVLLGKPVQVTSLAAVEGQPTWSADSQTIVYHAGLSRDYDLWSVPAVGGMPTWLTGAPEFGDYDPANARGSSSIAYASFSPDGQAPRNWGVTLSYDLPPGSWTPGGHSYYFKNSFTYPEPGEVTTNPANLSVIEGVEAYDGYALLRPFAIQAHASGECRFVDAINPFQATRFLSGWVTDGPLTYQEARAHFDSMVVTAYWDDGMSATLNQRNEIFPRTSQVELFNYICSFTEPPTRSVSVGNFAVEWNPFNPEEIVGLHWKESNNLTNFWQHPACLTDLEYFGNSWVSENEGTDQFFFASLVGWGMAGTWSQNGANVQIGSKSSGCPGSANFQIHTNYQFFEGDKADLIKIERTFEFGETPFAHNVRPFIPRLYPADGFTQVIHPDAGGTSLVAEGTCPYGCTAASWDGSWFAIHNPATGLGMIVQHVPSSANVALWLDDDGGSFTNASSVLLLQPEGGFTGTVTETEYLCFYDEDTWTPSLTLPAGCQP